MAEAGEDASSRGGSLRFHKKEIISASLAGFFFPVKINLDNKIKFLN